jgi:hypothetical protein
VKTRAGTFAGSAFYENAAESRSFKTTADRKTRAGRIIRMHKPAVMRSEDRRLGAVSDLGSESELDVPSSGFGNHGPEATGLTKSDESDDCMQKKSENVAHAPDGIKLKKLKNSIGLWNSPTTGVQWSTSSGFDSNWLVFTIQILTPWLDVETESWE